MRYDSVVTRHILVPRLVDADNLNPQNQNAKALLSRFADESVQWSSLHYFGPDPGVASSKRVRLTQLLPKHLWKPHLALWYQKRADAIFYPGPAWMDEVGIKFRAATVRAIPIISTIEGMVGNEERQRKLSAVVGRDVYCQRVEDHVLRRIDRIYELSAHIIAISPFLASLARELYGDKVSVQMLGINPETYKPGKTEKPQRLRVVNTASFQERKRPEMFMALAERFPAVDFTWFGDGDRRQSFIDEARRRNLSNIAFPGIRKPGELAAEYQRSHIFAIPSNSEGVPKVTQEAAGCALPIVIFGHYESPTVVHQRNGFVAWSDSDFFEAVERLLADPGLAQKMGAESLEMSREWHWDRLAPLWERQILSGLNNVPK